MGLDLGPIGSYTLLDRVEGNLHAILTMPYGSGSPRSRELVALNRSKVPFFIPGALTSRASVAFGLKISLCATFCYILYHALAWPGISTIVTTVIVTGLSSSGAIKQRLIFRLLGSVLGGLILAIGATVFLFPHMDSITSLVVLEAVVAFISAWIAAGTRFNYIGLQIAFSFYVVAYEGLSAPTELAPARDRFVGILLALGVMLLVFDQLWPTRTTAVMRRSLASLLHVAQELFITINASSVDPDARKDLLRKADHLRDQVGKSLADLRSMNASVPYEFGANREQHILAGDMILRAGITLAAVFWNQLAILHNTDDTAFLTNPALQQMRQTIAAHLSTMAEAVVSKTPTTRDTLPLVLPSTLPTPSLTEYAANTTDRFEELCNFTNILSHHA